MVTSPTTWTLNDIFVVAPNDIWAVGDKGTYVHWNGTGWALSGQGVGIGNSDPRVGERFERRLGGRTERRPRPLRRQGLVAVGERRRLHFQRTLGPGPGDVWVAGTGGGILRRHGGP